MMSANIVDGLVSGQKHYDLSELKSYFDDVYNDMDTSSPYDIQVLYDNLDKLSNVEFNKCDNAGMKQDVFYSAAKCIEKVKMDTDSNFEKFAKNCDISVGELFSRKIRHTVDMFLCCGIDGEISSLIPIIDKHISDRSAFDEFNEKRYHKSVMDEYDNGQGKVDKEVMKNMILDRENISRDMAFEDLPAYVTEELESSGVSY